MATSQPWLDSRPLDWVMFSRPGAKGVTGSSLQLSEENASWDKENTIYTSSLLLSAVAATSRARERRGCRCGENTKPRAVWSRKR